MNRVADIIIITALLSPVAADHPAPPYFYDPPLDPIPYAPKANAHGPDYDIPDDPWKVAADRRINRYRKSDLRVRVVDRAGAPVAGVAVRAELKRQTFRFGAVATPGFFTGPAAARLKPYVLKYFNSAGFGMGLKPSVCREGCCGTDRRTAPFAETAAREMRWFNKHEIGVRGHTLAWEGKRFLHPNQRAILDDPDLPDREKGRRIFALMSAHFHHAVRKWDVFCWDVINEPRANHAVNDLLPETNTFVAWFTLAGALRKKYHRPALQLYYNENNLVSWTKYGSYEKNRDNYIGHIRDLIDAGAPLDGIGFQYRFRSYVPPGTVYRRLCDFDRFDLPYQATEFELVGDRKKANEQGISTFSNAEKKRMTAELMTIFFSHRRAAGFWHWSFIDRPKTSRKHFPYALFTHDGRPNAEMEQWIKMMEEDFATDETRQTGPDGTATVRGFNGTYRLGLRAGTVRRTAVVVLGEDATFTFTWPPDRTGR